MSIELDLQLAVENEQGLPTEQDIQLWLDKLFDRSGRYPKLTESGLALIPYAQAAISQLDRLNNRDMRK